MPIQILRENQRSQFQVKYFKEAYWKEISELDALEILVDEFGRVTPFIIEMAQGKEIITPDGIIHMKTGGNDGKGLFRLVQ